jgi:hypothetical protein
MKKIWKSNILSLKHKLRILNINVKNIIRLWNMEKK